MENGEVGRDVPSGQVPLTKHLETRGGIRERMVPYGRKDNYENYKIRS